MQAKNVTIQEMTQALRNLNIEYKNNIEFRRIEQKGNLIIFTLKVKDKNGLGSQENPSYAWHNMIGASNKGIPKRSISASWFAHGNFFNELLKINPKAIIHSNVKSKKLTIDINGGNWQEIPFGNDFYGHIYMSELADNEP